MNREMLDLLKSASHFFYKQMEEPGYLNQDLELHFS